MVQWLCLLNDSLLQLILSCPHNGWKGVTNEPFSKTITDDLALTDDVDSVQGGADGVELLFAVGEVIGISEISVLFAVRVNESEATIVDLG